MTIATLRETTANYAVQLAEQAGKAGIKFDAGYYRTLFLRKFDEAAANIPEPAPAITPLVVAPAIVFAAVPPADPLAEAEVLAASIVASAAMASGEIPEGAPSEAEALAREIAASAPQGAMA